jgi:hypothetical protein
MGMMQTIIFASVTLGLTLISCSRELTEKNVPSLVQNAFRTQFVDARDVDWQKKDHHYLVEFETGDTKGDHEALFDTLGTMILYKFETPMAKLPSAVVNTIQSQYQDYKIDDIEKLEQEGVTYYQVELAKGMKDLHLVFSDDGVLQKNIAYWD